MKKIFLFLLVGAFLFAKDIKVNENNETITPLGGKEILVVEAKNCKFCKKFKQDVLANYHGTVPIRVVKRDDKAQGFNINGIKGTPTIIFIENGKELYAFQGYMEEKLFYKALAILKFGKSHVFQVAFNGADDDKFSKEYQEFNSTKAKDGIFVDRISGDALFDTNDRFESNSGWLSFYNAIEGATIQREDNSTKEHKIEVIAKKSGAHLGYVFNDAPDGKKRFSINASILEFVPRDKLKHLSHK